jgi:membrane protein implicated in regulation of membrane protease activity
MANTLSQQTSEALQKQYRSLRTLVIVLGVIAALCVVVLVVQLLTTEWKTTNVAFISVVSCMIAANVPTLSRMGAIKKELDLRSQQLSSNNNPLQ